MTHMKGCKCGFCTTEDTQGLIDKSLLLDIDNKQISNDVYDFIEAGMSDNYIKEYLKQQLGDVYDEKLANYQISQTKEQLLGGGKC